MYEIKPHFNMRHSRMLHKLRSGQPVFSVKICVAGAAGTELAAMHGFDAVWTCMEHTPNGLRDIEMQVMATKNYDCDLIVRVPRGSYSDYVRPLELDATGIMVPHIMSADDARDVVQMTRFAPIGRRPKDGGNADGSYGAMDGTEYREKSNSERMLIFQIEDPEALECIDEIAAVPGYDMLFFGPGDYSHVLGTPDQFTHPEIIKARKIVAEAALRHGKYAGTVSCWPIPELLREGYRYVNIGSDVRGLNKYYSETREQALGYLDFLKETLN